MMGRLKSDQGQLFYEFHLGDAVPEDHWCGRSTPCCCQSLLSFSVGSGVSVAFLPAARWPANKGCSCCASSVILSFSEAIALAAA
jgi:hypothetical protein